jgi:Uma2 family endonuclease
MAQIEQAQATMADLYREEGKAELIGARIVRFMPTGFRPGRISGRIFRSLDDYAEVTGEGVALPDNVGFAVTELSSGRQSFSPDATYYAGRLPEDSMRFIEGPPTLAVEVQSENDYGAAAEADLAAKRADYFEAGTLLVWDVDPHGECIHVYDAPTDRPRVTYRQGDTAEAEPAVPAWRVPVTWIFS